MNSGEEREREMFIRYLNLLLKVEKYSSLQDYLVFDLLLYDWESFGDEFESWMLGGFTIGVFSVIFYTTYYYLYEQLLLLF